LIRAQGELFDPNLQVRIGTTERPPDFIAGDGSGLELQSPASSIIAAPSLSLIGTENVPYDFVSHNSATLPNGSGSAGTPDYCALTDVSAAAVPSAAGDSLVSVNLTYGKSRTRDEISNAALMMVGSDVYGLSAHPYLSVTAPSPDGKTPTTVNVRFREKTDTITSNDSLIARDLTWTPRQFAVPIAMGPTFTSAELLEQPSGGQPGAGSAGSGSVAGVGSARAGTGGAGPARGAGGGRINTGPAGGTTSTGSTETRSAGHSTRKPQKPPISQVSYRIIGTGMQRIKDLDCLTKTPSCLQAISGDDSAHSINLDGTKFRILDDSSAFFGPTDKVPAGSSLELVWIDPVTKSSQSWGITVKEQASSEQPGQLQSKPAKLHKGDSLAVEFIGQDFSNVATLTFEDDPVTILAKDKTSITALITTKITSTSGDKTLVATPSSGKPILLPIQVVDAPQAVKP
jgi:hypothetical protein